MDKRNYAFDRTNFTLLAIGFAIVVIGFILMSGSSSTEQAFNPDIFSFRRIKVAPVVCFVGFISMIYAIIACIIAVVYTTIPMPKRRTLAEVAAEEKAAQEKAAQA